MCRLQLYLHILLLHWVPPLMLPLKTSSLIPPAEIINIIQNDVFPVFHTSITKFQQFESLNVGRFKDPPFCNRIINQIETFPKVYIWPKVVSWLKKVTFLHLLPPYHNISYTCLFVYLNFLPFSEIFQCLNAIVFIPMLLYK